MIPVSASVVCIRAHNPSPMTLDGTNCYIVSGNDEALLIDVGPDEAAHLDALADYLRAHRLRLRSIWFTHTHSDHIDGLANFRQRVNAPVSAFKAGYDVQLKDGDHIAIGADVIRVIHTPGHSSDCVCFLHEREGVLFTGDTVLGSGTSVLSPAEGDVGDYLDSLERLKQLPTQIIAPGHGPMLPDPRAKLDEYIEHRAMRERQISAQLQTGPKTIPQMVEEIYKDVDKQLHGAAARSVLAHLKRMERLGKVNVSGDVWTLT
jgi:glyoxylase-like metal-dependent hydrolase (beta-lactamase superfamily II)